MKRNGNPNKYTPQDKARLAAEARAAIQEWRGKGYEIIQVDESLFCAQDWKKYSWSRKRKNVTVKHIPSYNKKIAIVGAISLDTGASLWSYKEESYFKGVDIAEFVKELA